MLFSHLPLCSAFLPPFSVCFSWTFPQNTVVRGTRNSNTYRHLNSTGIADNVPPSSGIRFQRDPAEIAAQIQAPVSHADAVTLLFLVRRPRRSGMPFSLDPARYPMNLEGDAPEGIQTAFHTWTLTSPFPGPHNTHPCCKISCPSRRDAVASSPCAIRVVRTSSRLSCFFIATADECHNHQLCRYE
ncbi:hypothetical protein C8R46DRAFT_493356 [Mycena filopes]|nr:hypothetical protein C8R46DRAFT_493356 [Mycena filopes]